MTLLNGVELSPCIVSKAKYALQLKSKKPSNTKTCSDEYWSKVIEHLAKNAKSKIDPSVKEKALKRKDLH